MLGEIVLPPDRLFFTPDRLNQELGDNQVFYLNRFLENGGASWQFDFHLERSYHGRMQDLFADLAGWLGRGQKTVFVMSSKGLAERLVDIFREYEFPAHFGARGLDEALAHSVSVIQGKVSEGFYSDDWGFTCSRRTMFSRRASSDRRRAAMCSEKREPPSCPISAI